MLNLFDIFYKRFCSLFFLFLDMMYVIVYYLIDFINLFVNIRKLLFCICICNECFVLNVDFL